MTNSALSEKSLDFAIRIVNIYKFLCEQKNEHVMSRQLLRSGTSIGANVREGRNAQSNPDFITKMNIALKEADETQYWLEVLLRSGIIEHDEFDSMNNDLKQIIAMLVSTIKTLRSKLK